jgi:hypothetical protein
VGARPCLEIGLHDNDHVERLRKGLMQHGGLIVVRLLATYHFQR